MEINDVPEQQGVYILHIGKHDYVGSSKNIRVRIRKHLWMISLRKHEMKSIRNAAEECGFIPPLFEVLELCPLLTRKELLDREKFYIEKLKPDLNAKLDPITERNCLTTSREVYQYNLDGSLVKKHPSMMEASRTFKAENARSSGIRTCCLNPKRQRIAYGFLWSFEYPYPYAIKMIYAFKLDGSFVGSFTSTIEIAEKLYPDVKRKTSLSQIKKKIDSGVPYLQYYFSYSEDFTVTDLMKKKYSYKHETLLKELLRSNPLLYIYDKSNNLLGTVRLDSLPHKNAVRNRIMKGRCYKYSLVKREPGTYRTPTRRSRCWTQNNLTGEVFVYDTKAEAAVELFGEKRFMYHILKHIKRNTDFKGYKFRDL